MEYYDFSDNFKILSAEISSIGADPTGGLTRLLYTKPWLDAQMSLKKHFEDDGLNTHFDDIGNLFGRIEGSIYPQETIMSGSHIDTVVNGGNLDGQYGILAPFLAMKYLKKTYGQPLRSIEVVSLAEEEGSRFPYVFWGSKNMMGIANNADVENIKDAKGIPFVEAMQASGFNFHKDTAAVRQDIKAFLEIHIEQGNVLEMENKQIGVVHSIAGQKRYNITLKGQSNHAGTTPMKYRKDTVFAFSKFCVQSIEKAKKQGDPLVLTFGKVNPSPNTVNVVPGQTLFTMDCRHTDANILNAFTMELEQDIQKIGADMGIEVNIDLWMNEPPIPMDNTLVKMLEQVCQDNAVNYRLMHSGAGHDSQIFAPRIPTAMLFVPSINGISHNPEEATKLEDLAQGIYMLASSLYRLAYKK